MKIGLTGASGFVGQALLHAVRSRGDGARGLYRSPSPETVIGSDMVVTGDLAIRPPPPEALAGLDVVVHLAARTHVLHDKSADPLAAYHTVNVTGSLNLANAAVAAGVRRLVFLSSVKVNGESTPIERPYVETDPPAPLDAYGQSKLEAERTLLELGQRTGLEIVIVRPPLIYGPGVKGNLRQLLRLIQSGVPLPLGGIRNLRSFVSVDNLAGAVLALAEDSRAAGETFLVADGEDLSTPQLVRALAAGLDRKAALLPFPSATVLETLGRLVGRSAQVGRLTGSLRVDSSKLRRVTAWTPSIAPREGLAQMAAAFLREPA